MESEPDENASTEGVDPDLYLDDFAEMLRDLMRAIAAADASGSIGSASERMRRLMAHVDRLPASLSWYRILEGAVNRVKVPYSSDEIGHDYVDLANRCTKYLAELTTWDGFSAARISKARHQIQQEIRHLQELREAKRGKLD